MFKFVCPDIEKYGTVSNYIKSKPMSGAIEQAYKKTTLKQHYKSDVSSVFVF